MQVILKNEILCIKVFGMIMEDYTTLSPDDLNM